MSAIHFISIAVFGAVGALGRYGISKTAIRVFGDGFPFGTLIANILGCLAIGYVMELGNASPALPDWIKTAITVGLLGALTTFSAFGFETLQLMKQGSHGAALLNVGANLIAGIFCVWFGTVLCKTSGL